MAAHRSVETVVHTCPRCELRFEREAEVADHLVNDHRFDPDALRPHPVPRPRPGHRLVVVLGNFTLQSDALRDRLRTIVAAGDVDVHVVVPVHNADDLDIGLWRGRALAERLAGPSVDCTVDAGVGDPVAVLEKAVSGLHIDRIVVSMLPKPISRWLESDLVGRLEHVLAVPVEFVTAEG
jgi:hypothetical protein